VTGPGDAVVLDAAAQLIVDGGSDLYGGLVRGYDLAKHNFDPPG